MTAVSPENGSMADRVGPRATTSCEPRQARKGAAAAVTSGAVVWLARNATLLIPVSFFSRRFPPVPEGELRFPWGWVPDKRALTASWKP